MMMINRRFLLPALAGSVVALVAGVLLTQRADAVQAGA